MTFAYKRDGGLSKYCRSMSRIGVLLFVLRVFGNTIHQSVNYQPMPCGPYMRIAGPMTQLYGCCKPQPYYDYICPPHIAENHCLLQGKYGFRQ